MWGIGSDGGQGLGSGSEENAVDEILVLVSDGSDRFGNREDDMKIVRLENFGRSFFDPLGTCEGLTLWTVAGAPAVLTGPPAIASAAPHHKTPPGPRLTHPPPRQYPHLT